MSGKNFLKIFKNQFFIPFIIILAGIIFIILHLIKANNSGAEVKIEKNPIIMPAAYNVYCNSNILGGKYYLFKSKITNNGNSVLENVIVKYNVPGYIDWTELSTIGKLLPGQSVVVSCYPKFDKKITKNTTESVETANINISWDGAEPSDIIEEDFSFKILGVNDFAYTSIPAEEILGWNDKLDNKELLACFVTPNDPVVKNYTQAIQSKILKGEDASVSNSPEEVLRVLLGVYEMTRLSGMVYSGTKGLPQSLDDVSTTIQHIRLPRELITNNTGLCIELSLLYCSVLSNMGLDPVIFLVPGHAYPGIRLIDGSYCAIEATGINGEGLGGVMGAEDALNRGMQELEEFYAQASSGNPQYSLIDIHYLNQAGITGMELEDNDYLNKKTDDITANLTDSPNSNNNGSNGSNNQTNSKASSRFPGTFSFNIPANWLTYYNPNPNIPIAKAVINSPDQYAAINVYDIPANSPQNAMNILTQELSKIGISFEYNSNGQNIEAFSYPNNFKWNGKIGKIQGGYRVIIVGAFSNYYNSYYETIANIFNSIK